VQDKENNNPRQGVSGQ